MRLLRQAERRRMPWKNGGGTSIEIAVHPPGSDLAHFDWRLSMATVTDDGPFSIFDEVDRTLCLLEGASLDLEIAGQEHHRLTPDSPPLSFPADAVATARLENGAISDLNVMTRRGVCRHRVVERTLSGRTEIDLSGTWNAIFLTGRCFIEAQTFCEEAVANDVLVSNSAISSVVAPSHESLKIYMIEIFNL
ncbi:MAG: HutD family protein [Methylorubrum populi]